jgi:uncharacterized protein YutE (UPF0331/DUF86 family)
MKGFRNILVHEYGHINDRLVYEAVTDRLDDFEAFRRTVVEALRRVSG